MGLPGPSRNSFQTGRRPHHTNVMGTGTGSDFRLSGTDASGRPGSDWITTPGHFKASGWLTLGGGKTFHPGSPPNFDYPESWSNDTGYPPYYDFAYFLSASASKKSPMLPATNTTYKGICPGECESDGKGGSCTPAGEANATGSSLAGPIAVWCSLDEPDEHFYDSGLGTDTIKRLQFAGQKLSNDKTPFFIQSGFARPHTPWRVPQRFWDLYTTSEVEVAEHKLPPSDMPGVAWQAHSFFNQTNGAIWPLSPTVPLPRNVQQLARHAYMASVSWMDYQVGRIMDELEELGLTSTTVCVLHGDHGEYLVHCCSEFASFRQRHAATGWQLGEHNSWHKYTNFELGVRVPLIIRAPMLATNRVGVTTYGLAELVDVCANQHS